MKTKHIILITAILLLTSCIVNPIFFKKDLVEITDIVGHWHIIYPKGNKELAPTLEITAHQEKEYLIDLKTGDTGFSLTRFIKLNDVIYADIVDYMSYLSRPEEHFHNVYRFEMKSDTLVTNRLDIDYVHKGIKSGQFNLSYRIESDNSSDYNIGDLLMITASTEELQEFIIENEKDTLLFPVKDEIILKKIDATFYTYFPEEAWAYKERAEELKAAEKYNNQHHLRINELKIDSNYNKYIQPLIKDFPISDIKYKPFYFSNIVNILRNGINKPDMNEMCHQYVLNQTVEFFHYFSNRPVGYAHDERAMKLWAKAINTEFENELDKEIYINSVQKNCENAGEHLKRLSATFVILLKETGKD